MKEAFVFAVAAMPLAMALAGGAQLSVVADAEVATCGEGVGVFDDRSSQMTAAAAKHLAGKTFFLRTISGGFSALDHQGYPLSMLIQGRKVSL